MKLLSKNTLSLLGLTTIILLFFIIQNYRTYQTDKQLYLQIKNNYSSEKLQYIISPAFIKAIPKEYQMFLEEYYNSKNAKQVYQTKK